MTHESFYEKYKNQFGNKIKGVVIARELSDDDHPYEHWHLLIMFKGKVNIKGVSTLDFEGSHGSYEKVRSLERAFKYVTKGKDFRTFDTNPCLAIVQKIVSPFRRFVALCREGIITKEQAYSLFRRDTFVKDYDIIADYYTTPTKYQRFLQEFYKTDERMVPAVLMKGSFLFRLVQGLEETCKSVFLYGETGLGKTSGLMNLVHSQALFVRHTDQLKTFDPNLHKYIVFDDMCFSHTNYEYLINVVDATHDSQMNVKNSMVNVPSSSKKVFTSNKTPEEWSATSHGDELGEQKQKEAVMRRLYSIEIRPGDVIVKDSMPNTIPKGYFVASYETLQETILDVIKDAREKYFPKEEGIEKGAKGPEILDDNEGRGK